MIATKYSEGNEETNLMITWASDADFHDNEWIVGTWARTSRMFKYIVTS